MATVNKAEVIIQEGEKQGPDKPVNGSSTRPLALHYRQPQGPQTIMIKPVRYLLISPRYDRINGIRPVYSPSTCTASVRSRGPSISSNRMDW